MREKFPEQNDTLDTFFGSNGIVLLTFSNDVIFFLLQRLSCRMRRIQLVLLIIFITVFCLQGDHWKVTAGMCVDVYVNQYIVPIYLYHCCFRTVFVHYGKKHHGKKQKIICLFIYMFIHLIRNS